MHIPRHQKTYLSRAMTRAMALDHPIGDPHGGPAYGERNEPISAIIAVGTMMATGSAMMAGSIMAGVAFAGAALSLVGNITGNSTLSKIGMVAGMVGGAGMAGLFGEAAQAATWGSAFGGEAAAAGAGGAPGVELAQTPTSMPEAVNPMDFGATPELVAQAPNINASINAPVTSEGLINSAAPSLASQPLGGQPGPLAGNELLNATPGAAAPGVQTPVTGAPVEAAAPSAAAPSAPGAPSVTSDMLKVANTNVDPLGSLLQQSGNAIDPSYANNIRQMTTGEQMWQGVKDAGGSIMNLAKSNPGAAYMMGQVASGVGDYLSGKTTAQINQMEAAGQLSKAQADKIRYEIELNEKRRAQLNRNQAVPLNLNINPNGVQFAPGLIAGARTGG